MNDTYKIFIAPLLLMLLMSILALSPNSANAQVVTTCSWGELNDNPHIYSDATYDSTAIFYGNSIEVTTVLTSPFNDGVSEVWPLSNYGDSQGHELTAAIGPTYSWVADGIIGYWEFGYFNPSFGHGCGHSMSFTKPVPSITIDPDEVEVGDEVTIEWSTVYDPLFGIACTYNGSPIGPFGEHVFNAALSDEGNYMLSCLNQWGGFSAQADLTVEPAGPDCPATPGPSANFLVYPISYGSDPDDNGYGEYDPADEVSYTIRAYCDGNYWRLRVTSATIPGVIHIDPQSLAVVDDSNNALVNSATSCNTLSEMASSITYWADWQPPASQNPVSNPYVLRAGMIAHEMKHFDIYRSHLDLHYTTLENALENGTSLPIGSASNEQEAIYGMALEIDLFKGAVADAQAQAYLNATHSPVGEPYSVYNAAYRAVTDPYINNVIDERKDDLMCP